MLSKGADVEIERDVAGRKHRVLGDLTGEALFHEGDLPGVQVGEVGLAGHEGGQANFGRAQRGVDHQTVGLRAAKGRCRSGS